jgi:hypothetical protein
MGSMPCAKPRPSAEFVFFVARALCTVLARVLCTALVLSLYTAVARALVPSPVGGRAGETDVSLRLSLERGLVEPNENAASFQRARWHMLALGVGHTWAKLGRLLDPTLRLDATYFDAPAEISELGRGRVDAAQCLSGIMPREGRCQFHGADRGGFVTPSFAFNVLHPGSFSLGFFVLANLPIDVDFTRFVTPRVDFLAGGVHVGLRMLPWLTFETRGYVGSGAFAVRGGQNGTVAWTTLFGAEAERWLLPWKVGAKFGTYFDGDLFGTRRDAAYDAAYTAGYPERSDRIRMMRFGLAVFPYVQVAPRAALELGYVQKLFGYDTPATQFYTVGMRTAF